MLSNVLINIEIIMEKMEFLSLNQKKEVLDLLKHYKIGNWIYPGIFIRKIGLSVTDTYLLLNALKNEKILEEYYELYCNNCNKTTGEVYEVINQLPQTFFCELCGEELSGIENAVLVYKVIKE